MQIGNLRQAHERSALAFTGLGLWRYTDVFHVSRHERHLRTSRGLCDEGEVA